MTGSTTVAAPFTVIAMREEKRQIKEDETWSHMISLLAPKVSLLFLFVQEKTHLLK